LNSNIGPQTIPAKGFVENYGSMALVGIDFDGINTFTVLQPGLYHLQVTLNMATTNAPDSIFSVAINGSPVFFAPSSNADTGGQISIIRTQRYAAGAQIQIRNNSVSDVEIVNGIPGELPTSSAGHICFFRFADGGAT